MSDTTRLKLPLIAAQQAQKHVTHNESLLKLDVLVQARVLDRDLNTPPANPAEGDAYIVAASASSDWAGQEGNIAAWQNGGWVFHAPSEGWKVWVADEDALYVHDGAAWVKFETGITSVNPVPDGKLGINTTADNTNRLAVKSDAVLFSHDDVTPGSGDVQFKVNKAAATNTASLLFQDNWSGRAEMGLTGDDDFRVKVSPDGNTWLDSIRIKTIHNGKVMVRGLYIGEQSFYHRSSDLSRTLEIGGSNGSWTCNVQDGTGRVNYRWNASSGLNPVFQVSGDRAIEWDMDHNDGSCFTVRVSQPNPGAGNPVYWTELFRIAFTKVKASVPFQLPSYSKNALPSASSMGAGTMIYVHDDSAGPTVAFSDGTNWRRVHDRNVVA